MARSINHSLPPTRSGVTLLGRVGADPELRSTKNGTAVVELRLATDRYSKGSDKPETDWHTVIVWAKTAEAVAQYVHKGDRVYVSGSLRQRSWQTDAGERRSKVEVHANEVIFLDSRGDRSSDKDDGDAPF